MDHLHFRSCRALVLGALGIYVTLTACGPRAAPGAATVVPATAPTTAPTSAADLRPAAVGPTATPRLAQPTLSPPVEPS